MTSSAVADAQLLLQLQEWERRQRIKATEEAKVELRRNAPALRVRCRSLAAFVREAWPILEPATPLVWNWHLDALCEHLEAVTAGKVTRLLINIPPGSSKSMIVSAMWPAWEWGPARLPATRYLVSSFAEDAVKTHNRRHRELVDSDWYQALWPEVQLDRRGELSFSNTATGMRDGSAFGSLTSKRADRLIIDDPHNTKTAESDSDRRATVRLFREGAINRLNDQARSAVVVVMQRQHEEDVSGAILTDNLGYVHLMLPMEFEIERRCVTAIGFEDPRTVDGELLDPVRFPQTVVDRDFKQYPYSWAGQYQQRPAPRGGAMFKPEWFGMVGAVPAGARRCRAWDLAATVPKAGRNPDWTVGLLLAKDDKGIFYIEGLKRDRLTAMGVEQLIVSTAKDDTAMVRIRLPQDPGQAGKSQAQQFIRKLAGYSVTAVQPSGDKVTRAEPAAAQAEVGNVKIVRTGDVLKDGWIEPFLSELAVFPAGSHDDQVDAFADALNELALGPGPVVIKRLRI